jgi:hypothetical protein
VLLSFELQSQDGSRFPNAALAFAYRFVGNTGKPIFIRVGPKPFFTASPA